MNREPSTRDLNRAARLCFAQTLLVLVVGLLPIPVGWAGVRSALESARSSIPFAFSAIKTATASAFAATPDPLEIETRVLVGIICVGPAVPDVSFCLSLFILLIPLPLRRDILLIPLLPQFQ